MADVIINGIKVNGYPEGYDPHTGRITDVKTKRKGIWTKPKVNLSWLRKAKISKGSHDPLGARVGSKAVAQHCVMEAVAVATGQKFTDGPVCTSESITVAMQAVNDSRKSDRERSRLKKVVPHILGTAPIEVVDSGGTLWERKDYSDIQYRDLEIRRKRRLLKYLKGKGYAIGKYPYLDENVESINWPLVKTSHAIEAILLMSKLRKRPLAIAKRAVREHDYSNYSNPYA